MSCERTHERYDEDEYFVKFFQIHPYLTYVKEDDELNMLKLKIQRQLIELSGSGGNEAKYSKEKCLKVYEQLTQMQRENRILISNTEAEMKQLLKNIKNSMNENMIRHYQNILDKI